MKKALVLLLALCLLLASVALADDTSISKPSNGTTNAGNTQIKLSIDQAYTVTIPQTLTFTYDTTSKQYMATGTVKVTECRLKEGRTLIVKITDAANAEQDGTRKLLFIKVGNYKVPYTVKIDSVTYSSMISSDIPVVTCAAGATTLPSQTLNFYTNEDETFAVAGDYTDTITFTVSVQEPPTV